MTRGVGLVFFFFNDTATTEIYTLSLHDALPIYPDRRRGHAIRADRVAAVRAGDARLAAGVAVARGDAAAKLAAPSQALRSGEDTSEIQLTQKPLCRPLVGKKKKKNTSLSVNVFS